MSRRKRYDFAGRTAVITGAASGIGRALSVALAARGANLVLADRNLAGLTETVGLASGFGVRITAHILDLADANAIAAFPAQAMREHGKIDVVVNNAGVALGGTFEQVDDHDFEWLININFWGVVRMSRAFLPLLRMSDDALLVNVSSIFGIIGAPSQTAYSASKFAVSGFSQSLRAELSQSNVSVIIVYPGGVATSIATSAREPKDTTAVETERHQQLWKKQLKMPAHQAAEIIVRGIEYRKPRILVGNDARIADMAQRLSPAHYGKILRLLRGPRRS